MGFELVTFASIHSSGKRKSKHPFPRSWETWGKNPAYTLSFSTCFKPTAYIPAGTFYSYQNPDYINISLSLSLSLSWWVSNTEIKGMISAWSSCNGWKRINYQTTNQLQLSFMKNFTCTNKRKYKC